MRQNNPTILVIFGATGDLFRKKLAAALFDLFRRGALPSVFRLVGFGRRPWGDLDFRIFLKETIAFQGLALDGKVLEKFLAGSSYVQGDIGEGAAYEALGQKLSLIDAGEGVCLNKLFYLAVAPFRYETIFRNLSGAGLTIPCVAGAGGKFAGWTRVLVEKPFGEDLKGAAELDELLGKLFEESQIYRIDHYLAKETIQNILTFRFANGIFEPVWNNRHIEKVELVFFEKDGVGKRGELYDRLGALRDIGQNHLLEMLALAAMENPGKLESEAVRRSRAKLLSAVSPWGGELDGFAARGQYDGYLAEEGVRLKSETETYFKLKLRVKNKRWRGVPFYLEGGKASPESKVEIAVHFKKTVHPPFSLSETAGGNILRFNIQPREGISLLFWSKKSGFDFSLEPRWFSFALPQEGEATRIPDAYERVIADAIRGDQTLFTSTDEVKAAWRVVGPILKKWRELTLVVYKKGSKPDVSEM